MISKSNVPTAQIALVAGLVATVALFRVLRATMLPELPNFSPVMAMALCGGLFLPGLLAWLLPIAIIVLSDLALNLSLGYPLLSAGQLAAWACLLIAVAFGRLLAGREKLKASTLAGVIIVNALIFYAMTNGVAWMLEPLYPRSVAGLVQALTTGLPGYPPTWQFFRNALVSDFLFVGLIFAVRHFALRTSRDPVGSEPRRLPG
jgi:hypothetical protein